MDHRLSELQADFEARGMHQATYIIAAAISAAAGPRPADNANQ